MNNLGFLKADGQPLRLHQKKTTTKFSRRFEPMMQFLLLFFFPKMT